MARINVNEQTYLQIKASRFNSTCNSPSSRPKRQTATPNGKHQLTGQQTLMTYFTKIPVPVPVNANLNLPILRSNLKKNKLSLDATLTN